jgi:hypothetical protein
MKKVFLTLFAAAVSVAAIAQFYVCKDGVVVYKIDDGIADSITFTEPNFSKVIDLYHDGTEAGYNYVDLGLTSGTKWATANVGADRPQDYGNYYAWGETTTKETYNWSTYLDGNISSYSDCGTDKDALKGVTDIAGTQYDAAYVNWGGKWRMPTMVQQDELINQCYCVWTESYNNSNVKGYIVYKAKTSSDKGKYVYKGETPSSSYSLSDAHIFLPDAGYRNNGDLYISGSSGGYWSSSLGTDDPHYAWYVFFYSDGVYDELDDYRGLGQSVRAVIPGE